MAQTIDELRKVRLEKLKKLESLKIPGFPAWAGRRETIKEVRGKPFDPAQGKQLGASVFIAGRLTALRGHGGLTFADLTDESGKIQLAFKKDHLGEKFSILELLDIGDFIAVEGKLFKTESGELTVEVANFELLTKSLRPLPSSWYGFSDVEERYRQRYVDLLMNPEVKRVFETRTEVVKLVRKYLDDAGFMEVETPILQPLYGGATAKPFITHHNALDIDLYLRVSDELYLKRLIVGGFEKVYEVGKDFRNEGIDRQHNPEFTMCEFYWAYANYEDLMSLSEEMISGITKKVTGGYSVKYQDIAYDFTPPWKRVTFRDLILQDTGVDIDEINTEDKLLKEIQKQSIKLDLDGVVGFSALLDSFYKAVSRPKIVGPMFLTDYPVEMMPLAKRKSDEPTKVGCFQLLVGGYEWIKAYNELNDPIDQKARWEEEMKLGKKGLHEYQVLDEDYIRALEYGMPPTAGWGFGIDRFVAFLTDQHTIKDTILFPTMKPQYI